MSTDRPGFALARRSVTFENRWLSVEEAAAYLGISRDTVYKWIERKRMPAHKVGRLWKFRTEEIDNWVRKGKAATDSEPRKRSAQRPGGGSSSFSKRR